jgi:hypothetical protein
MAENILLFWVLLVIFVLVSGCAYVGDESVSGLSAGLEEGVYSQDNRSLNCTRAEGNASLVASSGAVIGHYEVKIDTGNKCVAVETDEGGYITFILKNRS